jgi:hypothetical protein
MKKALQLSPGKTDFRNMSQKEIDIFQIRRKNYG